MKSYKAKILAGASALVFVCAAHAEVFDFSGGTPVYDSNRSTTTEGSGYHYDSALASKATVGFNWANSYYSGWGWFYSWDGINVSKANDPTANPSASVYGNAGEKAQYTSITATDGSGVSGGAYGIWYGNTVYGTGYSESSAGNLVFNELVTVSSIQVANTLVTANYLNTTLTDEGDNYLFQVLVYGLNAEAELTDNCVTITLSSAEIGVTTSWLTADLSSLNADGGLYGLYFKTYTDDFGSYGANSPSFFALDNIVFSAVPEPAECAAIFGVLCLAFVAWRRRAKK